MNNNSSHTDLEIAVIGMASRFPKANGIDELWQNLLSARECISFFTKEEMLADGADPELINLPNYINAAAVLENSDLFDASFFGYSPRDAEILDPQHRIFLETAWEAFEDAGYNPKKFDGPIGIYVGVSDSQYYMNNLKNNSRISKEFTDWQLRMFNGQTCFTTRISYDFNLTGPSVGIQTACSTSLVALHMACRSLLNGECSMALTGGASIRSAQKTGYLYQEGMISSPDGHCRVFDENSGGTVPGNGAGAVILKRLEDAIKDKDHIYAVIKGSAINNDGNLKVGFTAPSVEGQTKVILDALSVSEIDPKTINYVEAHGTGTKLGDLIEISALKKAFSEYTDAKQYCGVGSIKSNIGHLDVASGIAGFIKAVLSIKNKVIPQNVNFETPNPNIDFENTPFYVIAKKQIWMQGDYPRRAMVSSFGIGGANACVILEEFDKNDNQIINKQKIKHVFNRQKYWVSPDLEMSHCNKKENIISKKLSETADNIESTLYGIWIDLFGYQEIDKSDNFLNMGGDSLLAIRLKVKIKEKFNLDISLENIFLNSNFKKMVDLIEVSLKDLEHSNDLPDETGEI